MDAEGRQRRIASKWHEDNLLGPGRKMRSDKDRWNEVVARENLEELRAKLGGGSVGCSEHANLLVFFGFEAVERGDTGGRPDHKNPKKLCQV